MSSTADRTPKRSRLTRRELAAVLGLHPDSISRNVPLGLGSAIRKLDARGRPVLFDEDESMRWWRAWRCPSAPNSGRCRRCEAVLEDCQAMAAHAAEVGHAPGQCRDCRDALNDVGAYVSGCRGVN